MRCFQATWTGRTSDFSSNSLHSTSIWKVL